MDIQLLIPELACIIIALMIMFRLTHYAHFYAPSYFFWIGIILIVVGLISLVQPLAFLFVFNRTIGAFVLLSGSAISFISFFWPVKEHHSQSKQKIDDLLPDYSFNEFHEVRIKASPEKVKQTLQVTGVQDIPVVHLLMKIRGISDGKDMSDTAAKSQAGTGNFSTPDFNFFVVDPTEYISVMIIKSSMITNQPDKPAPPEIFTLEQFMSFKSPGYVKVAINFKFIRENEEETLLTTETRVQGICHKDSRTFSRYWRVIYPGSAIIRRVWLDTISKKAQIAEIKNRGK